MTRPKIDIKIGEIYSGVMVITTAPHKYPHHYSKEQYFRVRCLQCGAEFSAQATRIHRLKLKGCPTCAINMRGEAIREKNKQRQQQQTEG